MMEDDELEPESEETRAFRAALLAEVVKVVMPLIEEEYAKSPFIDLRKVFPPEVKHGRRIYRY